MFTHIHIENFRSFRDLDIFPLNQVNLIAGLNSTGKTGLLEAIYLALQRGTNSDSKTQPQNLPNLFRVFAQNADENANFWPWLFWNKETANDIKISLTGASGEVENVRLSLQQAHQMSKLDANLRLKHNFGPINFYTSGDIKSDSKAAIFSTHPSDPVQDALDYNRVILKRGKKKVEDLLRHVDKRLVSVEALQTGNRSPLIYADLGLPEMIPVTHLGAGFCRLLSIYSELLAGDAKILLIDEIENGLHHSVLPTVWKGLIAASNELQVQIFATTHSAECIAAADAAARESQPHELNLIRLDRVEGEIKATVIEEAAIKTALDFDWEVR